MKNKVLIYGSEGSMGKRYQAILNWLNIDFECIDSRLGFSEVNLEKITHFIVATPTETHLEIIRNIAIYKRPILCEKPISKSIDEVKEIIKLCGDNLSIMFQYIVFSEMNEKDGVQLKETSYNYFRTGNDGLYWDCMQPICLHNGEFGELSVRNNSPVWNCILNGRKLNVRDMDVAYVSYVASWLCGKKYLNNDTILKFHQKVINFMDFKGVK